MTGGGGTARKPLNRRESALAAMRATLTEFNQQSLSWEREVEQLFDEAEAVAMHAAFAAKPEPERISPDQDEQLIHVASQQQELARQQQTAVSELTLLRHLVEQQTELLTAFINVAESPCHSSKPRDAQHDPVVDAVQAQFEQLQKQVTTVNRTR